jgi:diacylglycerol kinase (ATP)
MPRWLVLVNRAAGRRSGDPRAIADLVQSLGIDGTVTAPASREELTERIVAAARSGVTHFVAGGGDGTLNAVVNALLPLNLGFRPTVGVLPLGTGGDLLRTFGIPQDVEGAARHLLSDETYPIDVALISGEWGDRYYVNVAQAGVGAAAAETAPKISRRLGPLRYPLAFAVRLPRFPKATVKLTTERRTVESEALAIIFANGQFFAGGWNVAPKATLVDGVIDIQVINALKREAPALVPKIIKGTHLDDRRVKRLRAAEFTLEIDQKWPIEADGDLVGNTPMSGRVVPAAISLKI